MKTSFLILAMAGLLTLGAASCAEKKLTAASPTAAQANTLAQTGEVISTAQAVEWTHRFQNSNPQKTWGCLFESAIYEKLLDQTGCQGLAIYNAINDEGRNTFVLTGVDAKGDMTSGKLADLATPCPPTHYNSPLVSVSAEQIKPLELPAGGIISLELAKRMTHRYQSAYPSSMWAGYYSAYVYRNLLEQMGCVGIRIYNGIKEDKSECYVLVGVNAQGADMTAGLLYDLTAPCPQTCRSESPLLQ